MTVQSGELCPVDPDISLTAQVVTGNRVVLSASMHARAVIRICVILICVSAWNPPGGLVERKWDYRPPAGSANQVKQDL